MKNKLIPFLTLARKEIDRLRRIWLQTLIPPLISATIYFIIFHQLFLNSTFHYAAFNYLQFLTPGLIIMPVISAAYTNTATSFFSMKFMRSIEELTVASISIHAMVWGFLVGSILRGCFTGLLITLIACFFTKLMVAHLFLALFALLTTSVLFGLLGLINGIYAKKFDDVGLITTFLLTPLTYLGGIFFPITVLSSNWQWVAHFNPLFYLISFFRKSMLGVGDINFLLAISASIALSLLLYSYVYYLLKIGKNLRS